MDATRANPTHPSIPISDEPAVIVELEHEQVSHMSQKFASVEGNNNITSGETQIFHEYGTFHTMRTQQWCPLQSRNTRGQTVFMSLAMSGDFGALDVIVRNFDIDVDDTDHNGYTALMLAVCAGCHNTVYYLIKKHGASTSLLNSSGHNLMMLAVRGGHLQTVKTLCSMGLSFPRERDLRGKTSLMMAADIGSVAVMKILLRESHEGLADLLDVEGRTALMYAVKGRHKNAVVYLVQSFRASIHIQSDFGWTALLLAATKGYTEIVVYLGSVDGCDMRMRLQGKWGCSILATEAGHTDTVIALISKCGVDINACDYQGWTVLMFAAMKGHASLVDALSKFPDLDPDASNQEGTNALMIASGLGFIPIATTLLAVCGAEIDSTDTDGNTALMTASRNGHTDLIEELFKVATPGVVQRNMRGENAMALAVKAGSKSTVRVLMPLYTTYADKLDSLMRAAVEGDVRVMQVLFETPRVDVNHIGPEGFSILMIAAGRGHLDMVLFLLEIPEIHMGTTGLEERSALVCACMEGSIDVVKALLAHTPMQRPRGCAFDPRRAFADCFGTANEVHPDTRCDVNGRDCFGWTALMHAIRFRWETLAIMLIQDYNADPTVSDYTNLSVFMLASMYSLPSLVVYLLDRKQFNLEQQTTSGWTALMFAGVYGTPQMVIQLAKAGAVLDTVEYYDRSAVQLCLRYQKYFNAEILSDLEEERIHDMCLAFVLCLGDKQDRTAPCSELNPDTIAFIVSLFVDMHVRTTTQALREVG